MGIHIWIVYSFIVLLAFLPFFRIDLYLKNEKYKSFLYLNVALVIWTGIIGIRLVAVEAYIIYYLSLLIYPLVMVSVVLLFLAVNKYLNKTTSKQVKSVLFSLVTIDFIIAMTNTYHKLFIDLSHNNLVTLSAFNQASVNIGFMIHSIISYCIILYVFILLINEYRKIIRKNKDYLPIISIALCFILGFTINFIHIFIYTFTLDPTLIVFYIFMYTLYFIFIIRDVKLLLLFDHNDYILDHYREMYLIVDSNGIVIDASDPLIEKFNLSITSNMLYKELIEKISKKAYIYKDTKEIENNYSCEKLFLHVKENRVKFQTSKYYGRLFLFYDETQVRLLMSKLNYVMHHDLMTELYNRNYFESVQKEYDNSAEPYGVILFDLDGLKLVNDFLGHEAGDDLLIRFSKILSSIKENDSKNILPIRLGGDEFLIIFNDYDEDQLLEIINKITNLAYHKDVEKNIGFSYGYSIRKNNNEKMTHVLKNADEKLYEMKEKRIDNKRQLAIYYQSIKSVE